MDYIIAIDQSTSGTKALLINKKGEVVYKRTKQHQQIYPRSGWVEHDPLEIYENVKTLLLDPEMTNKQLKALAITNQRETVVVWDKETEIPVYNAIVWQCRQTADFCKKLMEQGYETVIQAKTGLTLDAYFSATKVRWILDHIENGILGAANGKLLMGTMDSWLIWKLTNGAVHGTDYTNASRTLLFNIQTLQWDQELLKLFQVPNAMLPDIKSSNELFGTIADPVLNKLLDLPITGVIGDSQGALFGQLCIKKGMAKATYGTGTSVLMYTEDLVKAKNGLISSIAWGIDGKVNYALEGIIHSTGATINWLKDQMGLIVDEQELESLAISVSSNQGVYFIPAFVGLGAPYWNPYARAAIIGLNQSTGKAHIVRAALEGIAYQVKDVMDLIEKESGLNIKQLKVDGGATGNEFLMQFQADMLGVELRVSKRSELSAMGAAYLAGMGVGIWNSIADIKQLIQENNRYQPKLTDELKEKWYEGWKEAISCVLVKEEKN